MVSRHITVFWRCITYHKTAPAPVGNGWFHLKNNLRDSILAKSQYRLNSSTKVRYHSFVIIWNIRLWRFGYYFDSFSRVKVQFPSFESLLISSTSSHEFFFTKCISKVIVYDCIATYSGLQNCGIFFTFYNWLNINTCMQLYFY